MNLKIKTLLILLAILIVLFIAVSFIAPPPTSPKNSVFPPAPIQTIPTPTPTSTRSAQRSPAPARAAAQCGRLEHRTGGTRVGQWCLA